MAAGFASKALSTLLATAARWVEFGDGSVAPVHGSVQLDPATGLPIDVTASAPVKLKDDLVVFVSVTAAGDMVGPVDTTGYNSFVLDVEAMPTSTTFEVQNASDLAATWGLQDPIWFKRPSQGGARGNIAAAGGYHGPLIGRYLRITSTTYGTGTTTARLTLSTKPFIMEAAFNETRRSSSAATVSVTSVTSAATLKASNNSRLGVTIANDSTATLYILLGTGTVSATNYTYALPPKGTVASDKTITGFTGAITGIWSAANGAALVTEMT